MLAIQEELVAKRKVLSKIGGGAVGCSRCLYRAGLPGNEPSAPRCPRPLQVSPIFAERHSPEMCVGLPLGQGNGPCAGSRRWRDSNWDILEPPNCGAGKGVWRRAVSPVRCLNCQCNWFKARCSCVAGRRNCTERRRSCTGRQSRVCESCHGRIAIRSRRHIHLSRRRSSMGLIRGEARICGARSRQRPISRPRGSGEGSRGGLSDRELASSTAVSRATVRVWPSSDRSTIHDSRFPATLASPATRA
jgi:hypothetical protein